jgi:hypothetical protein
VGNSCGDSKDHRLVYPGEGVLLFSGIKIGILHVPRVGKQRGSLRNRENDCCLLIRTTSLACSCEQLGLLFEVNIFPSSLPTVSSSPSEVDFGA